MRRFLVIRELPGVTRDQYAAAQNAILEAARHARPAHGHVQYLGGFYVLGRGRAVCMFDAASAAVVREVNEMAGVSFTEVMEAVELHPHD
jgi:Protein of unknown function (DUF4242)